MLLNNSVTIFCVRFVSTSASQIVSTTLLSINSISSALSSITGGGRGVDSRVVGPVVAAVVTPAKDRREEKKPGHLGLLDSDCRGRRMSLRFRCARDIHASSDICFDVQRCI